MQSGYSLKSDSYFIYLKACFGVRLDVLLPPGGNLVVLFNLINFQRESKYKKQTVLIVYGYNSYFFIWCDNIQADVDSGFNFLG